MWKTAFGLSTNFIWSIPEYFVPYVQKISWTSSKRFIILKIYFPNAQFSPCVHWVCCFSKLISNLDCCLWVNCHSYLDQSFVVMKFVNKNCFRKHAFALMQYFIVFSHYFHLSSQDIRASISEVAARMWSIEQLFCKISKNSQENTCDEVIFLVIL